MQKTTLLAALLIACSLLFGACKSKKNSAKETTTESSTTNTTPREVAPVTPTPPTPQAKLVEEDGLIAWLQRTPCYGRCPSYDLKIYNDLTVIYVGKRFVEKEGWYKTTISKADLQTLQDKAKTIDYLNLADKYPTDGAVISDLPTCKTYMKLDGKEKMINNKHNAPAALTEFEKFFDTLFEEANWQKITPENNKE